MGILKRIFGKGDDASDRRVEKAIDDIASGVEFKVYPILKPGNWVGLKAGVLKQTIIGTQEDPKLVVGFGYDTPSNFIFLKPNDLEGKDPNAVLHSAYQNLEEVESPITISEALDGKVLLASGHDFSAEKILSRAHMLKAHELLSSEELIVSIPRRRCMMITSKNVDPSILEKFLALHAHAWGDDSYGNAPILNAIFVVQDAQIVGYKEF